MQERKWYNEILGRGEKYLHGIKKIIVDHRSQYQHIEIIDTLDQGRCLFLDGRLQSAQVDEGVYHEMLIHPPLMLHPRPEKILIIGGGEGACLREARKHSLKKIVMVEIDQAVVRLARKYLFPWHQRSFACPAVKIHYADGRSFLKKSSDAFDVITIDLSEPQEKGPSCLLFTAEFYRLVKKRLGKEGQVCLQAGSLHFKKMYYFASIYRTLKECFPFVYPYRIYIPSFSGDWGFIIASLKEIKGHNDASLIARRIKERRLSGKLKYYDPQLHQSLFFFPGYLMRMLKKEGRIIRDRQPLFLP